MNYDELVKSLRTDHCKYFARDMEAADAIAELSRRCEQFQYMPTPAWISVKERLPEPGVPCLCWCKGGIYGQIRWYGLYYLTIHRTWAIYDNDYDNQAVTHWMPLPAPQKEEA